MNVDIQSGRSPDHHTGLTRHIPHSNRKGLLNRIRLPAAATLDRKGFHHNRNIGYKTC